jgi:hypothetical protein
MKIIQNLEVFWERRLKDMDLDFAEELDAKRTHCCEVLNTHDAKPRIFGQ